ncbi:MAG: hypothetical protein IJH92_06240 [Mogibacterium sp.]|nr:hypothetical protein [Mogibacterium sp.]
MGYPANEITILTNREFMLLLAAAGLDHWYGAELTETEYADADDLSFNRDMAALYQKRIIDFDEEKAEIAEMYKPVFRVLRDAKVCIKVKSALRPEYVKGSYFSGRDVVSVERRTGSSDEIELYIQSQDEWFEELKKDALYPVTADESDGLEPFDPELPEAAFDSSIEPELVGAFELRSLPDGSLLCSAKLYQKGLFGITEYVKDEVSSVEKFSEAGFEAVLKGWIGGDK